MVQRKGIFLIQMTSRSRTDSEKALHDIWAVAQLDSEALEWINMKGEEPALPSTYKTGVCAQSSIAAAGLAAAELWRHRTGEIQTVTVNMKEAAMAFRSERYAELDGSPVRKEPDSIHGFYRCGDGGWIQIHSNYPNHRDGVVKALGCEASREGVAGKLTNLKASTAEDLLTGFALPAGMMRTPEEWSRHPQSLALSELPLLEIEKIGDGPPIEFTSDPQRPMEGVRVLEMTKVIAGPVIGRTLAEYGAEILWINGPHLDVIENLVLDMSRGKYPAELDLRYQNGRSKLRELASEADVFIQGYRPGSLASKGFSPEDLSEIRPGIICVELSAFSHLGPWAHRRGFDSIVQTVSGIGYEGGKTAGLEGMVHLPCQALDHATGYLGAFGAMIALMRRAEEGGSWRIRVSLAQTGRWLTSLGKVNNMDAREISPEEIEAFLQSEDSPYGNISYTRPAAVLSRTASFWEPVPSPFGTYEAKWQKE